LGRIAAACRFSSPAVRALHQTFDVRDSNTLFASLYTRLGSRDAKWFTRLVLKNYQPVQLSAHVVFFNYHPLLPQMMKIRDDLSIATAFVRHIKEDSTEPSTIASILKPHLGTKVGRQPWFKGRSIKNCMDMARGRELACEQKLDGEYCQIHIDLRKPHSCIHIFSKSGKDSTTDRINLHQSVRILSTWGRAFTDKK
jgi:DNA ligase-4